MIYDMMYRDADNYKKWFRAEIKKEVQIGDEILMQSSGLRLAEFFIFMGWAYSKDRDHNIVEVVGISNDQIIKPDIIFFEDTEEQKEDEEESFDDDLEYHFAVDIPHVDRIDSGEWTQLATFKTREEAIAWAMENLGADENGMISVISSF
jgi:hypothetical protein